MATKKETHKATKDETLCVKYDIKANKWHAIDDPNDLGRYTNPSFGPSVCPINGLHLPQTKIVVVVAENPTWIDYTTSPPVKKSKKLECGRAAAQAAHAVSKLKLSYVIWQCQGRTEKAYESLYIVEKQPITTIVVKARDSEELYHISTLAKNKNLHVIEFQDDNDAFYGTNRPIWTAVAIGPYNGCEFDGITDYLPLWKCRCD